MTLERAVEELVAATIHAEDVRRGDPVDSTMGRVRLLRAIDAYRGIAGVKRLRVLSVTLERA